MSYRLIDANALNGKITDEDYEVVLNEPCIYADLPNGLDNEYHDIPKWIPVSEKLPKADEYIGNVAKYYLVQNEYGDMLVARYTHSGYWEQIYQLKPISDEIVAWRSLPGPYETESEEQ